MKNEFNFCEILDGNVSVGITAFWEFEKFLYVEHIAINKEQRKGGYGTKAFEYLKKKYDLPIILEAEIPENEIQKRRIKFYENSGFKVNEYKYFQPPYHKDTEPLELKVLSFPKLLNESEFEEFVDVTRNTVYEVK